METEVAANILPDCPQNRRELTIKGSETLDQRCIFNFNRLYLRGLFFSGSSTILLYGYFQLREEIALALNGSNNLLDTFKEVLPKNLCLVILG